MNEYIEKIKKIPEEMADEKILGDRGCGFDCVHCFYNFKNGIHSDCKIRKYYNYEKGEVTVFRQLQIDYIMNKMKIKKLQEILK